MRAIMTEPRLRVAVLLGGSSAEREVSLESGRNVAAALEERGHQVVRLDPSCETLESLLGQVDIILPMLHGTGAEDGSLQRQLEELQIPWLGSSSEASALTFDKDATRERLSSFGLPVPPGFASSIPSFLWHCSRLRISRLAGCCQTRRSGIECWSDDCSCGG